MKKTLLALLVLSAFAAACHERKAEPRPDYDGAHTDSEKAHKALDNEAHSY
jgi:nitrous oxide reductase accessory protein NosL